MCLLGIVYFGLHFELVYISQSICLCACLSGFVSGAFNCQFFMDLLEIAQVSSLGGVRVPFWGAVLWPTFLCPAFAIMSRSLSGAYLQNYLGESLHIAQLSSLEGGDVPFGGAGLWPTFLCLLFAIISFSRMHLSSIDNTPLTVRYRG